jgi:hypothetical protein
MLSLWFFCSSFFKGFSGVMISIHSVLIDLLRVIG